MQSEHSYINKPFQPVLKDHRLRLSASHPWTGHSAKKEKKKGRQFYHARKPLKHIFLSTQLVAGMCLTNIAQIANRDSWLPMVTKSHAPATALETKLSNGWWGEGGYAGGMGEWREDRQTEHEAKHSGRCLSLSWSRKNWRRQSQSCASPT